MIDFRTRAEILSKYLLDKINNPIILIQKIATIRWQSPKRGLPNNY
jgi:hypothetical protein